MKIARYALLLGLTLAAGCALAQSDAQKSFDRLKSLSGTWAGEMSGQPGTVTYKLVSGGSAIMEDMSHDGMISMFTLDGDRLLMTHYCGAGNQPRMVGAISPDGKSITFDFLDATNLASPQIGHMQHAVFTFADADHYSEDWTWTKDGQTQVHHMDLHRTR